MSLAVLPGYQQQVGFANPVPFTVHAKHVSKAELLPWEQWELDQVR